MKFTSKMTDTDIAKGIVDIGNRSASIRVDLQHLIVSITRNWAESGAVNVCATRMSELLNEMDAAHQQKLVNWCAMHCQFELMDDEDGNTGFAYNPDHTKMTKDEFIAAKGENMFVLTPDPKPVKVVTSFGKVSELVEFLQKRAKASGDKRHPDDDIHPKHIEALQDILSA